APPRAACSASAWAFASIALMVATVVSSSSERALHCASASSSSSFISAMVHLWLGGRRPAAGAPALVLGHRDVRRHRRGQEGVAAVGPLDHERSGAGHDVHRAARLRVRLRAELEDPAPALLDGLVVDEDERGAFLEPGDRAARDRFRALARDGPLRGGRWCRGHDRYQWT